MRSLMWSFLGLAVLFGVTMLVAAKDEKVPLDKVPAKVMEAVKAKYPKAKVESCEKEEEDGKPQFELLLTEGDKKFTAIFSPEGKFLGTEEQVADKDVPAAAKKAFEKKYAGAKVNQVLRISKEGETKKQFEFQYILGKKKGEAVFDEDGKFIKEE